MRNGQIRFAEYHWERLFEGMRLLHIQSPGAFRQKLEEQIRRTVAKNRLESLCRIRLQIYAGDGGLYDPGSSTGFVIENFPLESAVPELNENGLILGVADAVKHSGPYSHLKCSNALPYAIAAKQARLALWNDALLRNAHGNIADSTIANIFWTKNKKIYTTPLSEGGVAGVMRRHLLELLPNIGYEVGEKALPIKALADMDSVFLCNSIRGIRWVRAVGEYEYPIHELQGLWHKVRASLL